MIGNTSRTSSFVMSLRPARGWTAILIFILLTTIFSILGAGKIVNFGFPIISFVTGSFLYFNYPILYHGFTWWLLFLTPFIRRYADYHSGFTNPSPILLAPYLVILISSYTLWQELPKKTDKGKIPFIVSILGVIYGFSIGLIQNPPVQVCIGFLDWLCPILWGFYLYINWRNFAQYKQNTQKVFLWGVLVTGSYGVIQYLVVPEWDRYWRLQTDFVTAGVPEPLTLNIFSTMNSNGPFAMAMMAGLLILIGSKGELRFLAISIGFLAFFLSNVRSAWVAMVIAFLVSINSLKPKQQIYLIITTLVILSLAVPLLTMEPFAHKIGDRLGTFSNLENDGSATVRIAHFVDTIGETLAEFIGKGIGSQGFDNALLILFLHLGYIGTVFYVGGLFQLYFTLFQRNISRFDSFVGSIRGITIATASLFMLGPIMLELSGIILWGFLGLSLAAEKFYQEQAITLLRKNT